MFICSSSFGVCLRIVYKEERDFVNKRRSGSNLSDKQKRNYLSIVLRSKTPFLTAKMEGFEQPHLEI